MDILEYSAVALSAVIREGKFTATEAMEAVLARIDEKEKDINAYVTIDREQALGAAASAQEKIEKGELTGPLVSCHTVCGSLRRGAHRKLVHVGLANYHCACFFKI